MNNFREVNDEIIKEWLEFREETAFCNMTPQDKKYCIYFDELAENILKCNFKILKCKFCTLRITISQNIP